MSQLDRYLWLLHPDRRGDVLRAIRAAEYDRHFGALALDVVDGEVPYVRFLVPENREFVACLDGLYLDLTGVAPDDWPCPMYFPALSVTDPEQPRDVAHELQHLQDILALLDREPDYPDRARVLAIHNLEDMTLLAESIDFEVWKVFALEPAAHRLDFAGGLHAVELPVDLGRMFAYRCATEDEYIKLQMAGYVAMLLFAYLTRFPDYADVIGPSFIAAVDRHGGELFGPDASLRAQRLLSSRMEQVSAQTAGEVPASGERAPR